MAGRPAARRQPCGRRSSVPTPRRAKSTQRTPERRRRAWRAPRGRASAMSVRAAFRQGWQRCRWVQPTPAPRRGRGPTRPRRVRTPVSAGYLLESSSRVGRVRHRGRQRSEHSGASRSRSKTSPEPAESSPLDVVPRWCETVCTDPSWVSTIDTTTDSGSQEADRGLLISDRAPIPRANASPAFGDRTATMLSNPASVNDVRSSDASSSESSLHVTPIACGRWPLAIARVRDIAPATYSEVLIAVAPRRVGTSKAAWSMMSPWPSWPSTRTDSDRGRRHRQSEYRVQFALLQSTHGSKPCGGHRAAPSHRRGPSQRVRR